MHIIQNSIVVLHVLLIFSPIILIVSYCKVYYNELETRVRLSKRRQKVGQQPNNTRLIVRHRPLNAIEFRMQRYREKQLEPPGEDDEDEEEEEEEQEAQQEMEKIDGKGLRLNNVIALYFEDLL